MEVKSGVDGGFTIVQSRERAQARVSKVRVFVCLCVRVCVRTHARAQQACLSTRGKYIIGGRHR